MAFPSTLSTFNRPTATDRLNSPSHSALHNTVSSAVGQIEAVIGVEGATSVVGTLEYFIKSPDSNGGGHVQTANKGGTGQTTFTKGDMLVATSSSVVAKLAVGIDNQILTANSSTASGVNWKTFGGKISNSASVISVVNTVAETSIFSITIPASTLGTSNTIRGTVFVSQYENGAGPGSVLLRLNYGGGTASSIMLANGAGFRPSVVGNINFTMIANNSASLQKTNLTANLTQIKPDVVQPSVITLFTNNWDIGSSSVQSSASQVLGLTVRQSIADAETNFVVQGYTIETIV